MREEGEKGSDVKQKQERPYFILLLLRAINSHILIWQRRERRTWVAKVDAQTTDIYFYTQRDQDRAFQFGQKKFRFDSRCRIDFFDSIRQSDKFAACTLIFK